LAAPAEAFVAEAARRLLGRSVASVARIHGGRNSQVYGIECDSGRPPRRFVLKRYHEHPGDPRDRLGTEYAALQFLAASGVTRVPAAVAFDRSAACAIYGFVRGVPAAGGPASDQDIRQLLDFLADLKAIARAGADAIGLASEACLSIDALVDQVRSRTARLRARPRSAPLGGELTAFLDRLDVFASALDAWTDERIAALGGDRSTVLPSGDRTLSPSDFGLHNALRDDGGTLRFVDFEYFGWDDPAKTIADVLLHPAMTMSEAQRRVFAAGAMRIFADQPALEARAPIVFPWFGVKWCLILLNEFSPVDRGRRRFAAAEPPGRELLQRQLQQAEAMFERIVGHYRRNPYFSA
jgi:hypothetical protein